MYRGKHTYGEGGELERERERARERDTHTHISCASVWGHIGT